MRRLRIVLTAFCGGIALMARAQAPTAEPPLEEVLVTGEFPGPGLWKVSRADDPSAHVLWIVAEPPPLPRRLKWKSRDVEAVAATAQVILRDADVKLDPDERIGVFRGLSLLPAAMKARKNPGDARLQELVPPEAYARWRVQKKRFLGGDRGIEQWRPIFAADKLRREALDDLGLRAGNVVWDVIGKLAKQRDIPVTVPTLRFTIRSDDIKPKLKAFSLETLPDVECFTVTLDYTEALSDGDTQARRARAWATADLETLAELPPLPNPAVPCVRAMLSSQVARETLPADLREQLYSLWVDSAVSSLQANPSTLAVVPLGKLVREDGYLARLVARGLVVEAPR